MNRLKKIHFEQLYDDSDYIPLNINLNETLTAPQRRILEDTFYLQVAMVTTIAVLAILPESISKWDSEQADFSKLGNKWRENVKAGPVMDEDDWGINYLGHPISGAIYYAMARNDGLDPFESFLFSSFMSTFVWEYGYEAFAEVPSIQDLWSTPIIGSFMGEGMHILEQRLDKNHGLVFNSRVLGNISYWLLDPMGRIADGIGGFLDLDVTMRYQTYQIYNYENVDRYSVYINKPAEFTDMHYGFVLNVEF